MVVTAYTCRECGYPFRAETIAYHHKADLMCPSCGSIEIELLFAPPAVSATRRAVRRASPVRPDPQASRS